MPDTASRGAAIPSVGRVRSVGAGVKGLLNVERQSAQRLSPLLATVVLALVVVLPNANGLASFFVGDDFDFLARMQRMQGAGDAIRMTYWGEWEPLWYLSFYRDWKLWGLDPVGYHAASLFWLALGVVALFRLVKDLWPEAGLAPWAAALLFATHPLHDEAVTYIAARAHPMSTALALVAIWSYVRMRRETASRASGVLWLAVSLVAALLAALAKETALMIPVWVVALEWCVFGDLRPKLATLRRTALAGLVLLVPVGAYLALRYAAVGLSSHKLRGPGDGVWDLLESCVRFIPEYALIGGLPIPFAFLGHDIVTSLRPLGWMVVMAVALPVGLAVVRSLRRTGRVSRPIGIYVVGLVIVLTSLLPVFWADLEVKRRYFFAPSAGAALAAAMALQWIAVRRSRAAWALVAALALGGAIGLIHRNELYSRAGRISLDLLETARGAPLERPSTRTQGESRRIALLTLPRYVGGDGLSGAYLLHGTDVRSVFRLAGVVPAGFATGHRCLFADDYRAEVAFTGEDVLDLTVSFRSRRAYEAARGRDPRRDQEGDAVRMVLESADDEARVLSYKVILAPGFFRDRRNELYLYSDGAFRRLTRAG